MKNGMLLRSIFFVQYPPHKNLFINSAIFRPYAVKHLSQIIYFSKLYGKIKTE